MDKDIKIAKIVANATPTSWSQAYNAGKLFSVISLAGEEQAEENSLNLLGKEVLDNLEAEYFALETKDLEGIKNAVLSSLEKIPQNIKVSFVVGTIVNNILYVFAKNGKLEIKRGEKLGKVLDAQGDLQESSGFLEDKDIIVLETSEFSNIISSEELTSSIDSRPVSEVAESLAPKIHEKEEAGACAIILEFKKEEEAVEMPEPIQPDEQEVSTNPTTQRESIEQFKKYFFLAKDKAQNLKITPSFDRSRRTVLFVAVILLVIFLASVFFALKKQGDEKVKALVAQYYAPAAKKYDEGQSLVDLNKALARDDFSQAQKILIEGEPKFPKGGKEQKQVDELLNKVNNALSKTANINNVSPSAVDSSESKLLSAYSSGVQYVAKEDSDIYSLDVKGVNKNGKQIIKKAWDDAGGLGVYFGNVYVLDKSTKQIYKFVSTSSDYVKTNYFTDTVPGVSTSASIAIDGSIWVLLSDGTILKYTKGNSDNLNLTGLDKPFSSPTRIFTDVNSDNVYILDNGNSRIVVFDKKGDYVKQYQNSLLKDAKDMEVNEKGGKILFLGSSKTYSFGF